MKCGWLASFIAVSLFDANLPGCYGSLICIVCHMLLIIVLSTQKFYLNGGYVEHHSGVLVLTVVTNFIVVRRMFYAQVYKVHIQMICT